jgi:hypothetical protein
MTGAKYDEALARLREATRHQHGLELGEDVRDAMNAFFWSAAVEDGQAPELTCGPIVETFLRWARTVETAPEVETGENDEADDPEPDEETISGLQLLGRALVAHLARAGPPAAARRNQADPTPIRADRTSFLYRRRGEKLQWAGMNCVIAGRRFMSTAPEQLAAGCRMNS